MTRSPFVGATALITIKRNCCPYPSMSSCAVSCCTCFPKALSAFATLASSPTGGAPLSSRSAFNYSEQYSHRRPNQKPPLPRNRVHFGSVPSVAERWWSSRDLLLPKSNSALHPLSTESPHDTTIPISLTRCLSPPTGVVRPSCPQISYPLPTSPQTLAPTPRKIQPNPSSLSSFFAPLPLLEAFLLTPTPFNLHNCLPTGGFLQTAVSDAPRTTSRTYLRSSHGAHPIQH
jgi:hypothetical protein